MTTPAARSSAMRPARPSSVSTASVSAPIVGAGPPGVAGVPVKRAGWRGWRIRPATGCTSSTKRPTARGVGIVDQLGRREHDAAGHPLGLHAGHALGRRHLRRGLVAPLDQCPRDRGVLLAQRRARDARVVVAVDAERAAHPEEVGVGRRRRDRPPVGEVEGPRRRRRSCPAATRRRRAARRCRRRRPT